MTIKNEVMKENEMPERIYLFDYNDAMVKPLKGDTMYVREDVFIEKADKFINSFFHPDDTELKKVILDEFHKYMKG